MVKKVILIESMSIIKSRLKQAFSEGGYEVHVISDGRTVLNSKKFNPSSKEPGILDMVKPDLITLSLDLEDASGLKILKTFKTHNDFKKVPIVVTSSQNDKETIVAAISTGAADYVLKKQGFVLTLISKVSKIFEKDKITFESTLKREIDWVKYGGKELSFAMIMVRRYATGKPIDKESYNKVFVTLKSKMRHYDWVFPLDDTKLGLILPVTTLKDVVILRERLLELLKMLSKEIKLPMDIQIGFSHYPVNAKTSDELIYLAEEQIQE